MFGSGSDSGSKPALGSPEEQKIMRERDAGLLASLNARLVLAEISKWEEQQKKMRKLCGLEGVEPKVQDFAESFPVLKPQDPKVMRRLSEAENYDSPYFRYSKKAAEGENVTGGERIQAFPFHVENGGNLFMDNTAEHPNPNMHLLRLLMIPELKNSMLKDTSFNDKKNLALSSKLTYREVGYFYEVYDTNRADFLGNDCRLIQIGTMDDDHRPVVVKSSRVSLMIEKAFGREGLEETQFLRMTNPRGITRNRVVQDKMMPPSEPILLYTTSISEIDDEIGARTEARHIMMTEIPFKATAETYNRSPRLSYQNSFLHMWRGLEAIYNVGPSIETLDISCQPMLTPSHAFLVLSATPNLKRLTLRKNHLLRISDTKPLMEIVNQLVPGCVLDFSPYFFYGALHRDIEGNFEISKGSFGLTWEDSGVKTEKFVALFVKIIRHTEAELGMEVLGKGMGLRDFLSRLPLRPGVVDRIIEFWDDPELGMTGAGISWQVLHQIVEPNAPETFGEYKIITCRYCDIKAPQFLMHVQNCCAFCTFQFFANAETDRYRQEKEDIANSHLILDELMQSNATLGSILGAEEIFPAAISSDAVVVKGFWDQSVGPWTPVDTNLDQQFAEPVRRCRKLYRIRLHDLSLAYNKKVFGWAPTREFGINCRKPGFQERGPGDHEFFPVQHDNVFKNERRVDIHTGESYHVAFLPDELNYNSRRVYVRAGDWDRLRVDFTKSERELREEYYREKYSPW
ncbi:hypothetical protein PspLS_04183 [Pyricularia sp. CBS 133598]|nr:hypothetical protein PspLS_04183 [Pyricularia sp. CBS 133598]